MGTNGTIDINELENLDISEIAEIGRRELDIDWSQSQHVNALERRKSNVRKHSSMEFGKKTTAFFKGIIGAGYFILMLIMLTFIYIVMPALIPSFIFVEYLRVEQGVELFDPETSKISAFFLTSGLAGLMIVAAHTGAYGKREKPSLRLSARYLAYFLGIGSKTNKWKSVKQTENQALIMSIASLVKLIVFLGIIGPLSDEISANSEDVAWLDGLKKVLIDSELLTMLEMIGGGAVTAVSAGMLHYLVDYNYGNLKEVLNRFLSKKSDIEQSQKEYMIYQIRKQHKKAQKPPK
jgi:hypothetical protein